MAALVRCPPPLQRLLAPAAALSTGSRASSGPDVPTRKHGGRVGPARPPRPPRSARPFSVLNRPRPDYPGHVPLTALERSVLAVGSAAVAMVDPYRHDMVAALGEATATPYFVARLRDAMLAHPTGRRILRERPRISSASLPSLPALRAMPANSLGAAYVAWLDRERVTPDTRAAVRHVDGAEAAYVVQRLREGHDFLHALTGLPVVTEGELALKAFEWANTLLPVAGLSLAAAARLTRAERGRFLGTYLPWALHNGLRAEEVVNVYWEEQLGRDVDELRAELGVEKPVDLREARRAERARRRGKAGGG
ncbi:MAG: Ubiquinone biosynthesis protein [Thelocarpon impressellum]|nr:MAG: Ubiquinone biosynthesis protein [Thelocarpon impressellum]